MSQADEDEDYMFLIGLLPPMKKLDDIQKLEHRTQFLSSVSRRIRISKKFSQPFNSVPIASNSSCRPSPPPHAASLGETHSWESETPTHTLQISCISSAGLLPRQFQVPF